MIKIELLHGDITKFPVDAVVNAANTGLIGGGGVDGAIREAAGEELYEACEHLGGCKVGEAKATPGFRLPAKYIIHTVGPMWYGGEKGEAENLRNCYLNSLKLADSLGIRSIAFPAISCGVYGYPIEKAANVAITAVNDYLKENKFIEKIIFVMYSEEYYNVYSKLLKTNKY